ncbi:Phospholipid phosphatase 1 [Trichoplax sp. H2]|nr:Phospholipid phosphatase 1 [Trichoplax sp. H2]|eukprot:RDD47725.1 Phospholipid phosphatase 1 [Trichoplax sp. H2]
MKSENSKLLVDFLVTLVTGFCILFIQTLATPSHRGFFCNDDSIKYPYKPHSTVPNIVLILMDILYPTIMIFTFETLKNKFPTNSMPGNPLSGQCRFTRYTWNLILSMLFGLATTFVLTDSAKFLVGSLRPNFLALCQPDFSKINCSVGYVTQYTCLGTQTRQIKDARLSFPSGHASTSAYAMVFSAIYLESVWKWKNLTALKGLLQGISLLLTWLCGLSRVHDYRHRWIDVLTGFILGISIAFFTAMKICNLNLFENNGEKNKTEVDAITFVESNPVDLERKQARTFADDNDERPI